MIVGKIRANLELESFGLLGSTEGHDRLQTAGQLAGDTRATMAIILG